MDEFLAILFLDITVQTFPQLLILGSNDWALRHGGPETTRFNDTDMYAPRSHLSAQCI